MDSMRSLNTSLPGASPRPEPPEQLLQAFKAAALSVTQLYKTAAADQTRARSEGFQDALDELLSFLDKENLGLSDGEGWRIRRWATERLNGREQHFDSDEDVEQERASSPTVQRTHSSTNLNTNTPSMSPNLVVPTNAISEETQVLLPPSGAFTFRSQQAYPDADPQHAELDHQERIQTSDSPSMASSHALSHSTALSIPRSTRHSGRSSTTSRFNTRTSGTTGRVTGQKRKINMGDFFDISNIQHHRDGTGGAGAGGAKRGRFA